jgi:hypothetical protein
MPFVTTNIMSLAVQAELNKRWLLHKQKDLLAANDSGQPRLATGIKIAGGDNYMSLPLAERMNWINTNVIPAICAKSPTSRTELMLQSVGAENIFPHADKIGVFRLRSTQ